ncbi:hypothetical protein Tco_0484621 [Tanacetum coccineum]
MALVCGALHVGIVIGDDLEKLSAFYWTWVELAVSVQCFPSNPSLPLVLVHHLTIEGGAGFCKLPSGHGYRGEVSWEVYGESRESTRDSGLELETVGVAVWVLAVNWGWVQLWLLGLGLQWLRLAVTGLGLGLQSLHSLCQLHTNGAVEIGLSALWSSKVLHNYTLGLSRPSDGLKIASNRFFSSGSVMTADSSLAKKAFKERENWYLEDIVDLEEKLSSHDRIVYKMGQSIQTIHMLGKKPNKVYDPFLKAGLGYKNPKRLKKVIAAQPKMYDGERLHSAKLTIDSPDSEETLEDAEESRLKMRNKMVQITMEN